MRSTVNSVDLYFEGSLLTELEKQGLRGQVTVQCCDDFDSGNNCEAIELEFKIIGTENAWIATTLNYENALFLANNILNILEHQKRQL